MGDLFFFLIRNHIKVFYTRDLAPKGPERFCHNARHMVRLHGPDTETSKIMFRIFRKVIQNTRFSGADPIMCRAWFVKSVHCMRFITSKKFRVQFIKEIIQMVFRNNSYILFMIEGHFNETSLINCS